MDEHDETQHQASPGDTPGEGIRIIGADEAAAAVESGKASGGRGDGMSHVGDHPEPPAHVRPLHRFPRPASSDEPTRAIDLDQPLLPRRTINPEVDEELEPVLAGARSGAARPGASGWSTVRGLFRRVARAEATSGSRGGGGGGGAGDPDGELRGEPAVVAQDPGPGGRHRSAGGGGDDEPHGWDDPQRQRFEWPEESSGWGDEIGRGGDRGEQASSGVADFGDPMEDTASFQTDPPSPPPRKGRRQTPRLTAPRLRPPSGSDLNTRIATGVGVGIAAIILFKLGSLTALILALVIVTAAAIELFGVLRRAGYRPATLVALVATVGIMIGAYMKGEAAIPLVLALVVVFTLLWYLIGVVKARPTVNVGVTLLGFMWVGLLGSFAALLLDPRIFPNRHGVALLLGAAVATVGYDIGSFLVGARFGRHPLAPAISPNKTWEGLIGGTVASVLVGAVVVGQISPWTTARGIALGLVVAVAAPLGDLCESLLKRDIGVKDMGSILPGHGGVLDRADALLFVVPATYYLVRLINFGG